MRATTNRALLAIIAIALLGAIAAGTAPARPLAVVTSNTPPKVTKQPKSLTVEEGQSATFTATASGSPAPTAQWEVSTNGGSSWSPIEGATTTTLTIASATTAENGYQFRAVFKNIAGEAITTGATLTVRKAPAVTQQPANVTVEEGQTALFEATASGFPAPTVQWQTSANSGATWSNVSGATSSQLTLTGVKTTLNGHEY